MRLLVLRHGPAESRDPQRWPDDDDRPLTRDGRRETRESAAGLAVLEPSVRTILTSPAARALATAEIVRDRLAVSSKLVRWAELAPGAGAAAALARLATDVPARATVALVGHEPQLGELVGLALTGDAVSVTRPRQASPPWNSRRRSVPRPARWSGVSTGRRSRGSVGAASRAAPTPFEALGPSRLARRAAPSSRDLEVGGFASDPDRARFAAVYRRRVPFGRNSGATRSRVSRWTAVGVRFASTRWNPYFFSIAPNSARRSDWYR